MGTVLVILGRLGSVSGGSWGLLGRSWGVLEPPWAVLGRPGGVLGRLGAVLGRLGGENASNINLCKRVNGKRVSVKVLWKQAVAQSKVL